MSLRTIELTETLHAYLVEATVREPDLLQQLRAETRRLTDQPDMQIAPEQGQFMALLVELLGARRAIEIGTFTGYSALCVAQALPADGRLVCCDLSQEWTAIAQRFWREAGVAERIDLRIAPALETLAALRDAGEAGTFDFGFIDADKENYPAYYEHVLELLRPGGVLALDNALRDGRVVNPAPDDVASQILDRLNRQIRFDERVSISLVPIGDGLLLARKR
jgi:caffeoyl-CoA O-methyltransferase